MSNRVNKCAERAFIIDPAARDDCPDEFKGVVSAVPGFSSDIHAKKNHDLTCSFSETRKCRVNHIIFGPKMVSVKEIEKEHQRAAKKTRNKKVERLLHPEMLCSTALVRKRPTLLMTSKLRLTLFPFSRMDSCQERVDVKLSLIESKSVVVFVMRFPNFRKASYPNGNAQSCFILMQNGMAEVVMGVQPNTTQERFWLADITKLTRNNMQGSAKDS